MSDLSLRVTGFSASFVLTLIAYFIMVSPEDFGLTVKMAVFFILGLALLQSLVQLIFFIDVWEEKGSLWNLSVFVSTVSIIFVVIYFSIWIITHLNYHMH